MERELRQQIARLETMNDYLLTELTRLDMLMKLVGFSGGVRTIKAIAEEMYESQKRVKDE